MNIFGDITPDLIGKIASEIDSAKASGKISLVISSPGGDAFTGLAVFDMLKASGLQVRTEIVGICASAASIIALAGDERAMGQNAMLMLHPAFTPKGGGAKELREKADVLDAISARMGEIAASVAHPDCKAQIDPMMERELWLSADQALACGLASEIINPAAYAAHGETDMSMKTSFLAFLAGKSEEEIKAFLEAKAELSPEETMKLGELSAQYAKACADMDEQCKELDSLRMQIAALQAKAAEETAAVEQAEVDAMQARAEVFAALKDGLTLASAEKAFTAKSAAEIRAAIQAGDKIPQKQTPAANAPTSGDILAEYSGISDPRKRQEFYAKHKSEILAAAKPTN